MNAPALTSAEIRQLKATAQRLDPIARVGKAGLTEAVVQSLTGALATRELIKVRFDHDRPERDELATAAATATGATLIWQVGKVAVYFRRRPVATAS